MSRSSRLALMCLCIVAAAMGGQWFGQATYTPNGPGRQIDYVEFTGTVAVSATTEGAADTVVTGSSVAYNGATPVVIEFFAPISAPAASAAASLIYCLYEDGSSIGQWSQHAIVSSASSQRVPILIRRRLTPSNASHTYSVRAFRSGGNGSAIAGVGGSGAVLPGYIRITAS